MSQKIHLIDENQLSSWKWARYKRLKKSNSYLPTEFALYLHCQASCMQICVVVGAHSQQNAQSAGATYSHHQFKCVSLFIAIFTYLGVIIPQSVTLIKYVLLHYIIWVFIFSSSDIMPMTWATKGAKASADLLRRWVIWLIGCLCKTSVICLFWWVFGPWPVCDGSNQPYSVAHLYTNTIPITWSWCELAQQLLSSAVI